MIAVSLALAVLVFVQLAGEATAGASDLRVGPTGRIAVAAPCRAPAVESFRITGRVHACGGSLVDAARHRVRLLSYEVLSMYPGEGEVAPECGHWKAPDPSLAGKIRRWGMNSVQLLISWSNLEPTPPTRLPGGGVRHHWDAAYLAALDAAIGQYHRNGVAVVLSLGQSRWSQAFRDLELPNGKVQNCGEGMPMWLYPNGGGLPQMVRAERRFFAGVDGVQAKFRGVWRMLANRYRSNPGVVGAEMLFEAYDMVAIPFLGHHTSPASLDLASFYEGVGNAIHQIAPTLLVLYADWQSHNGNVFAVTRKPKLSNAASSFEFYGGAWTRDLRARFDRYRARAVAWKVPAWIDEFDAFQYGRRSDTELPGDPHWARDTKALLAKAKVERVGWSFLGPMDAALAHVLQQGH